METINENDRPESGESRPEGYVPRPGWQVWAARIATVVFIALVILQIVNIARGGR